MRSVVWVCLLVQGAMGGKRLAAEELTAFNYQGRLTSAGTPATGWHDLRINLFDTAVGGSPVLGPITNAVIPGENGVFNTLVDFGFAIPSGSTWIELAVRRANGDAEFVILTPRQPVLPVPQATRAALADAALVAQSLSSPRLPGVPGVVIQAVPSPNNTSEGQPRLTGGVTWVDAAGLAAGHLSADSPDRLNFRVDRPLHVVGGGMVLGSEGRSLGFSGTNLLEVLGGSRFDGPVRVQHGVEFADGSRLETARAFQQPNLLWVSVTGDDATGRRGDPALPWKSIGAALSNALSGDAVLILPGQYLVSTVPELGHQRTLAPLRIVGLTNLTVAGFGGTPEIYAPDFGDIFQVTSCQQLTIRNLHFRSDASALASPPHGQSAGICFRPETPANSHIWIENCRFTGVPHAITTFAAPAVATDYISVRNCQFQNCGWTTGVPTLGQDGGALTGFGSNMRFVNNVLDRTVRGVEFYRFPGDPIHTNALISDNIFLRYWDCAVCSFDDGTENLAALDSVAIVNNLFEDAPPGEPGGETSGSAAVLLNSGRGITVRGNVIRGGKLYGIKVSALTGPLEHVDISENQVSDVVGRGIQVTDYGPGVRHVRVTNNRLTGNYGGGILAQGQYLDLTLNNISDNYPAGIRITASENGRVSTDGRVFANSLILNTASIVEENTHGIRIDANYVIDPTPAAARSLAIAAGSFGNLKPAFHPIPAQLRSRRAKAFQEWADARPQLPAR